MPAAGIPLGDVLADSGYAHRDAGAWAIPLRQAGAQLVQDLHPHDRGPKGTHHGAIIANGNLYCPCTPRPLLELGPLARDATPDQAAAHDQQTAELARHKLGKITSDDADGYHRVSAPRSWARSAARCGLQSMTLDRDRPEILTPPEHPPACCTQQTITVPPEATAKTAQKHDYPSRAHRRSYARRTGAERGFATAKDPATNDISRGWCRLMGLAPLMLFTTMLLVVRNQRILLRLERPAARKPRRAAAGLRRKPGAADARPSQTSSRRRHYPEPAFIPPAGNTCREHRRHRRAPPGQRSARPKLVLAHKKPPVTHATDTTRPTATAGPPCGPEYQTQT